MGHKSAHFYFFFIYQRCKPVYANEVIYNYNVISDVTWDTKQYIIYLIKNR